MKGREKSAGRPPGIGGAARPVPIGDALDEYLERAGLAETVEAAGIVGEWERRVGDAIARVTRPLRVSRGVLIVEVHSTAWLTELRMMQSEILRRLNAGRGRGRIEGLRFVAGDPP